MRASPRPMYCGLSFVLLLLANTTHAQALAAASNTSYDSALVKAHFAAMDMDAREQLKQQLKAESLPNDNLQSGHRGSYRYHLYLLPSGRLAFPFTGTLTERDRVTFAIMRPSELAVEVEIASCGKVDYSRQLEPVKTAVVDTSGKARELTATRTYRRDELPEVARCADSLVLNVKSTDLDKAAKTLLTSATTTTIISDRVYLYALGGGYGYDAGNPERWSVEERPTGDAAATEKYLVRRRNRTGPGSFLSLGYRACGLNPRTMTGPSWCTLVSPTFIVPSSRKADEFAIAFPVFSGFGTEFLLGASVAQAESLNKNINAGVTDAKNRLGDGSKYSLPGAPPLQKSWSFGGVGFFVGISASTASIQNFFSPAVGSQPHTSSKQQATSKPAPPTP